MNRRHVIQSVLAGAAAAAFQDNVLERIRAATSSVNGRSPEDVASDEDYWAEIRNAFSVDRNIINLNNGYCQSLAPNGARCHAAPAGISPTWARTTPW